MGAIITNVEGGSAAERAGLKAGDVITAIGTTPVRGAADLRNIITSVNQEAVPGLDEFIAHAKGSPKRPLLTLIRDGGALFLVVQ